MKAPWGLPWAGAGRGGLITIVVAAAGPGAGAEVVAVADMESGEAGAKQGDESKAEAAVFLLERKL